MISFYLFKMNCLNHIALGIISGIITVNVQQESRRGFHWAMLSEIFIDGIPLFLYLCFTEESLVEGVTADAAAHLIPWKYQES